MQPWAVPSTWVCTTSLGSFWWAPPQTPEPSSLMRSCKKVHPLHFNSSFAPPFDVDTFLLVPDMRAWLFPVNGSFPPEEAHFNMCGSAFNSQASHFYPVTPTYSRSSCLSLAKYQEQAAFPFHNRVDTRFPFLTGLEIHQSGRNEVSFFVLPLWSCITFSDAALSYS